MGHPLDHDQKDRGEDRESAALQVQLALSRSRDVACRRGERGNQSVPERAFEREMEVEVDGRVEEEEARQHQRE